MAWHAAEHAWVVDPDGVLRALTDDGFQPYKYEIAREYETRASTGGFWQGLDPRTGSVATVIWVVLAPEAHIFIEVDGRPFDGAMMGVLPRAVNG